MKYHELLVEIGCEEMPASWLPGITRQLESRLVFRLDEARITSGTQAVGFNTPRRLGVSVENLADRQRDLKETVTGPPVSVAFDIDGAPRAAAEGFARKHGVTLEALTRIETPKGEYLTYHRLRRGRTTRAVLAGILAATLRDLVFPKRMRWDAVLSDGHEEFTFGRPIRWLLFLYGGKVVPFVIGRTPAALSAGVKPIRSGDVTYGHRFFSRSGKAGRPLKVKSFADYRKKLASAYVLIDRNDRHDRIVRKLKKYAMSVGGRVAPIGQGSTLLDEVPDLVEYPAVVTGHFPREFLSLPDEVLATTMIHHQHYFPVIDRRKRLKADFLAVTNTPRDNVGRIARNSERVLVARLRDASFFWDADRAYRLDDRIERLDTLLFHKKLGSYKQKSKRVATLADRIARELLHRPKAAVQARRAAELSKADLATEMVREFPELQGIMGGIYAREQGEDDEVCTAIYNHYLPIGIDADAPPSRKTLGNAAVAWAAVSLADKIDTVVGLFAVGEKPTGSRDPLGIRRQAQGMLRILVDLPELTGLDTRVSVGDLRGLARDVNVPSTVEAIERETVFLLERLRFLLEERGFDVRNVRAVTHRPVDELNPLDARRKLEVLPEFTDTVDFLKLALLFKRVKNIAREFNDPGFSYSELSNKLLADTLVEPAERALLDELSLRGAVIDAAVESGQGFRGAFSEAAKLGPAVDRFFTDVFVMAEDAEQRRARLRLVKHVEQLILKLADVSEIVQET